MFESCFQSFIALGDPSHGRARVVHLRAELEGRTRGFIVPRADEHQNEYVPAGAERLRWLTGFAGSAGLAVVLKDAAALFVDGRYTEQVKTEADASVFEFRHVTGGAAGRMDRAATSSSGDKLGYDPRLHTPDSVARSPAACEKAGAGLVAVEVNPIDAIWPDRPPAPLGAVTPHKLGFAGESAAGKNLARATGIGPSQGLLISDPHNLAWLFNIRGSDVSYTPLPSAGPIAAEATDRVPRPKKADAPASQQLSAARPMCGARGPASVRRGPWPARRARGLRRRDRPGRSDPGDRAGG